MKQQSESSATLKAASAGLFTLAGLSSLTLLLGIRHFAIPAAATFAFLGGAALVTNALLHPESIKIPDPLEVKVPTVRVEY